MNTFIIAASFIVPYYLLVSGPACAAYECFQDRSDITRNWSNYARMGTACIGAGQANAIGPMINLGRRYYDEHEAIDISISYCESKDGSYQLNIPRVVYLMYTEPSEESSIYYGGGFSWMNQEIYRGNPSLDSYYWSERDSQTGIAVEFTGGFEIKRHSTIRIYGEFGISQLAVPIKQQGTYPTPTITMTLGFGF